MRVRMMMKTASMPLAAMAFPALLLAQTTTPETPSTPSPTETPPPATPATPADPANPSMPGPASPATPATPADPSAPSAPPAGEGAMAQGGIRWAPMAQIPVPAPQAEYPPCTRELQDQCTNTRKGTDTPRRKRPPRV